MIVEIPGEGQVEFPDDMSDADVTAAIKKITAQPLIKNPAIQQNIRMATNMVSSVPEFLVDLPFQAGNWVGNKINSAIGNSPYTGTGTPVGDAKREFLKSIGVDANTTGKTEDVVQAGLNAAMGGGTAMKGVLNGALPASSAWAAKPVAQAAGAMTGVMAQDYAKESGLPEWAQIGANVAGNVAGSNVAGMAGGVGKGVLFGGKALLSDAEKQAIAARAFYNQANNPDLAIERLQNPNLRTEFLKGSKPITAEITQDAGISGLNKGFGGNQIATSLGLDQINNNRYADIANAANAAMNAANRRVQKGGTDILNHLENIKGKAYDKFADGKDLLTTPVDVSPVLSEIDTLKANYAGRTGVEKFLNKTERNLMPDGNPVQPFRRIWNARQDIDEKIYGIKSDYTKAPTLKNTYDSAGKQIRTSINDELKAVDPDFEPFLRRYSKAQQYGDAIRTGRSLQNQIEMTPVTAAQNADDVVGVNRLSPAQARKINDRLTDLAGNDSALAGMLTPRQTKTFKNVQNELERSLGLEIPRTGDSITANILTRGGLLSNDILDSIIGAQKGDKPGLLREIGQGVGILGNKIGLANPLEREVLRHVGNAAINPDYALQLLELGRKTARGPLDVKKALRDQSGAGLIGSLYGSLK
ncbi:MAG: hypothetical protein RL563_1113 [Pseudomonadota bacterium]|jgi:hypothetical protein